MKVTAILPDTLVKDVKEFSKGKNITESLKIALTEWVNHKRILALNEKIKKEPLKFTDGFSAESVRELNRR